MKPVETGLGIILDALNAELVADGTREDLCLFTIMPGQQVPADYVESCGGMAYVQLTSAAPSVVFPLPGLTAADCAFTLMYGVEVGILRPSPIPAAFGTEFELPGNDELANASIAQFKDLQAMYRAMLKVRASDNVEGLIPGTYTPTGPNGGVSGGAWSMQLGLD